MEGGKSRGRESWERSGNQSFRERKQLDQLLLCHQNLALKNLALGFSVLGWYLASWPTLNLSNWVFIWHVSHLGNAGDKGVPWNKICKKWLLFSSFSHIKIWDCHRQKNIQIWRGQFCRWHCADAWCPNHSLHWLQNIPLQKRHSVQNHVSFREVVSSQFMTLMCVFSLSSFIYIYIFIFLILF